MRYLFKIRIDQIYYLSSQNNLLVVKRDFYFNILFGVEEDIFQKVTGKAFDPSLYCLLRDYKIVT